MQLCEIQFFQRWIPSSPSSKTFSLNCISSLCTQYFPSGDWVELFFRNFIVAEWEPVIRFQRFQYIIMVNGVFQSLLITNKEETAILDSIISFFNLITNLISPPPNLFFHRSSDSTNGYLGIHGKQLLVASLLSYGLNMVPDLRFEMIYWNVEHCVGLSIKPLKITLLKMDKLSLYSTFHSTPSFSKSSGCLTRLHSSTKCQFSFPVQVSISIGSTRNDFVAMYFAFRLKVASSVSARSGLYPLSGRCIQGSQVFSATSLVRACFNASTIIAGMKKATTSTSRKSSLSFFSNNAAGSTSLLLVVARLFSLWWYVSSPCGGTSLLPVRIINLQAVKRSTYSPAGGPPGQLSYLYLGQTTTPNPEKLNFRKQCGHCFDWQYHVRHLIIIHTIFFVGRPTGEFNTILRMLLRGWGCNRMTSFHEKYLEFWFLFLIFGQTIKFASLLGSGALLHLARYNNDAECKNPVDLAGAWQADAGRATECVIWVVYIIINKIYSQRFASAKFRMKVALGSPLLSLSLFELVELVVHQIAPLILRIERELEESTRKLVRYKSHRQRSCPPYHFYFFIKTHHNISACLWRQRFKIFHPATTSSSSWPSLCLKAEKNKKNKKESFSPGTSCRPTTNPALQSASPSTFSFGMISH
ncbi:hypothetical protein VP01_1848g1 [Puccinia sorghi]|uniref:Uncharacterized protein n=1 Tax=Puccinia sorghi TaxID=27349 RepID=A0A0L6VDM3_9BASI|nr:hypothetical protein VP01_1848g1 [Puccinia sorghi]